MIDIVWAGSGIDKEVYDWFVSNVDKGATVVEFGGGDVSTPALSDRYKLYTVEEDEKWVGRHAATTYIHAPIVGNWYKADGLRSLLPSSASAVLVDGPVGKRLGLLSNLDILTAMRPEFVVFHDTYRAEETELANEVARRMNATVTFYEVAQTQAYWAVVHDTSTR
jgi:hypothetical protein